MDVPACDFTDAIMIASLTLSSYPTYSFLNLHILSDANRYIIVRLVNEDIKLVKSFSWYVLKGENNKVIDQDLNAAEERWSLLHITDYEGTTLFSTRISYN
jgi:hypothetical protein